MAMLSCFEEGSWKWVEGSGTCRDITNEVVMCSGHGPAREVTKKRDRHIDRGKGHSHMVVAVQKRDCLHIESHRDDGSMERRMTSQGNGILKASKDLGRE